MSGCWAEAPGAASRLDDARVSSVFGKRQGWGRVRAQCPGSRVALTHPLKTPGLAAGQQVILLNSDDALLGCDNDTELTEDSVSAHRRCV